MLLMLTENILEKLKTVTRLNSAMLPLKIHHQTANLSNNKQVMYKNFHIFVL